MSLCVHISCIHQGEGREEKQFLFVQTHRTHTTATHSSIHTCMAWRKIGREKKVRVQFDSFFGSNSEVFVCVCALRTCVCVYVDEMRTSTHPITRQHRKTTHKTNFFRLSFHLFLFLSRCCRWHILNKKKRNEFIHT